MGRNGSESTRQGDAACEGCIFFYTNGKCCPGACNKLAICGIGRGVSEIKKKGGVSVDSKTLFAAGARVRERMRPT